MDFIDGTMYVKHDGQFKPFMTLHNGCAHAEGHQSKAYGQYSHAEGYTTKDTPYDYLFKDIKADTKPEISIDTSKYNSTISELQNQIAELGFRMGEVTAAIRELREEIDKINKRDMFGTYFGVDYSKGSDF